MDILGKLCSLWLFVMLNCGLLKAQFSTDLLYKEVLITSISLATPLKPHETLIP
jgi:hypothetical protein